MIRRPPRATRTAPPFPDPTLFRSDVDAVEHALDLGRATVGGADEAGRVAFVDVDQRVVLLRQRGDLVERGDEAVRSEEHTSELQSLMRISYAVFCLKQQTNKRTKLTSQETHTQTAIHVIQSN